MLGSNTSPEGIHELLFRDSEALGKSGEAKDLPIDLDEVAILLVKSGDRDGVLGRRWP